jgi:hypothetical protein
MLNWEDEPEVVWTGSVVAAGALKVDGSKFDFEAEGSDFHRLNMNSTDED